MRSPCRTCSSATASSLRRYSCSSGAGNSPMFCSGGFGAPVHLARRLDQHVGDGGVQVGARDELDGGRDDRERLGGRVLSEVERARRHVELGEVAEAPHVRVALHEVEEADAGRMHQLAHVGRVGGVAHHEGGVGVARAQRFLGIGAVQVEEGGRRLAVDAVRAQQRLGENSRPASRLPDGDALAAQLGEPGDRVRCFVEHQHRQVEDAAQREEVVAVGEIPEAALHEAHVHLLVGVAQPLQVIDGSLRGQDRERHPFAREAFLVALGGRLEDARRRPARDHDRVGRRGAYEPERHPEREGDEQQVRPQRQCEVTPRDAMPGHAGIPPLPPRTTPWLLQREPLRLRVRHDRHGCRSVHGLDVATGRCSRMCHCGLPMKTLEKAGVEPAFPSWDSRDDLVSCCTCA